MMNIVQTFHTHCKKERKDVLFFLVLFLICFILCWSKDICNKCVGHIFKHNYKEGLQIQGGSLFFP